MKRPQAEGWMWLRGRSRSLAGLASQLVGSLRLCRHRDRFQCGLSPLRRGQTGTDTHQPSYAGGGRGGREGRAGRGVRVVGDQAASGSVQCGRCRFRRGLSLVPRPGTGAPTASVSVCAGYANSGARPGPLSIASRESNNHLPLTDFYLRPATQQDFEFLLATDKLGHCVQSLEPALD